MSRPKRKHDAAVAAFRQWTHGVSFTLAMGKSQVAALVAIHLSQDEKHIVGLSHRLLRNYVVGARGLEERGLIGRPPENTQTKGARWWEEKTRCHTFVTEPGELVVGLLKLSGVYDEVALELSTYDKRSREWAREA